MPYDFTTDVARFSSLLANRVERLSHIQVDRVLFGITISRKPGSYGTYAACQPLRFEGGEQRLIRRGREWEWPTVRLGGREVLYYVNFYVPRFLDLSPEQKIETVVHELFHISPLFNGDLRRLGEGRHAYHGPSRNFYDRLISPIVEEATEIVAQSPFEFLTCNHAKLREIHGAVTGQRALRLRPVLVRKP